MGHKTCSVMFFWNTQGHLSSCPLVCRVEVGAWVTSDYLRQDYLSYGTMTHYLITRPHFCKWPRTDYTAFFWNFTPATSGVVWALCRRGWVRFVSTNVKEVFSNRRLLPSSYAPTPYRDPSWRKREKSASPAPPPTPPPLLSLSFIFDFSRSVCISVLNLIWN